MSAASKETQKILDGAASRLMARGDCLKDVGVPDLPDAAYGALFFQP